MTNEELLFIDLSARQPYNLKGQDGDGRVRTMVMVNGSGSSVIATDHKNNTCACGFVPYLRSLSTMTNEEYDEMQSEVAKCGLEPWGEICVPNSNLMRTTLRQCYYLTSFFDRKSFDWRVNDEGKTLIELGLALEMPKELYNTNQK